MDETNHKKFNNNNNKWEFLKRTLQFVMSVSAISLFVWYSSGFSILPQSFNAYFSTCLLSMLAHTLERKYMFLICNAILAFLAKTSLFTSSVSPESPFDFDSDQPHAAPSLPSFRFTENAPLVIEVEELDEQVKRQDESSCERVSEAEEEKEEEHDTLLAQTQGRENEIAEEEVEGNDDGDGELVTTLTRDDELEDTTMLATTNELELANTDELNRKFEEFIRKMKEEMRIEAQRQPIAV